MKRGTRVFIFILSAVIAGCGSESIANPERAVVSDCYCGESEESALDAYRAIRLSDMKTVLGLINRRKISALEPGDKVHVVLIRNGLSRIRIASGSKIGERCWIPTSLLR